MAIRSFSAVKQKSEQRITAVMRGLSRKMRVALCGREHAGGFAIALGAMGGARHQAAGGRAALHGGKQVLEAIDRQGEQLAHRGEAAPFRRFLSGDKQDETSEQCLGLFVPMRFRHLVRWVGDQCIGKKGCILGGIDGEGKKPALDGWC